jgi:hypothetical protein
MTKKLIVLGGLVGSLMITGALPANATERANFRVSGIVHTVCRLDIAGSSSVRNTGFIDFGTFTQLCNAKSGFRVIMQHPTNMGGATLMIDGRAVPLSSGNETIIVDSSQPIFKVSDAQLDVRNTTTPVHSLSFRIEPKGAVY